MHFFRNASCDSIRHFLLLSRSNLKASFSLSISIWCALTTVSVDSVSSRSFNVIDNDEFDVEFEGGADDDNRWSVSKSVRFRLTENIFGMVLLLLASPIGGYIR